MTGLRVWVPGDPAPQGSKRHVGGGRMIESSKAVGPWRESIRAALLAEGPRTPFTGPVAVTCSFAMRRPKGHFGTGRNAGQLRALAPQLPAVKPDLDKLARAVLDAVTSAGVWGDDSQVVHLVAEKVYTRPGGPVPGLLLDIQDWAS